MTAHGIPLNTLKQCLQFLLWLHQNKQNGVKAGVARELHKNLTGKYNNVDPSQIESALSTFLSSVSKFHNKLCYKPTPGSYSTVDAQNVTDALLECIPKFLAVMYFLRYNVDDKFSALGGGGWANNQVGGSTLLASHLQKYLIASSGSKDYGVIPGGFSRQGDVKRDYRQGRNMTTALTTICEKQRGQYFRDVFSTSVIIATSGTQDSNTANALALVRTFCSIVEEGKTSQDGGQIKSKLDEEIKLEGKCICWNNLKAHCEKLKSEFSKIFTDHRFSFTGFGRKVEDLKKEEFAEYTAQWLRSNLDKVKENLEKIKTDKTTMKITADYFIKNLFPYGFTFDKYNFERQKAQQNVLQENWANVINELTREHEGLEKLKKILDGEVCPPEPSPEPEKISEAPKEVVPEKKVPVTPPQKPEVPPAKVPANPKAEGAQNQGKKSEGAQNQGKKGEGASDQNNDQSQEKPPGLPIENSPAPAPPSGNDRASGKPGPTGDQGDAGPAGPKGPVTLGSSEPAVRTDSLTVQPQPNTNIVLPQRPPQPPPPPLPAGPPASPSQPSAKGHDPGSHGGVTPGLQPAVSQEPALAQTPGVSTSSSDATGGRGTGQDVSGVATLPAASAPGKGVGGRDSLVPNSKKPCPNGLRTEEENGKIYCYPQNHNPIPPNYKFNYTSEQLWNDFLKRNDAPNQPNKPLSQHSPIQPHPQPPVKVSQPTGHNPGPLLPTPQPPRESRHVTYKDVPIPGHVDPYASTLGSFVIEDQPRFEIDGEAVEDKSLQEIQDEWNDRIDAEEQRDAILNKIIKETQDYLKLDADILNAEQTQLKDIADLDAKQKSFNYEVDEHIEVPEPYTTGFSDNSQQVMDITEDIIHPPIPPEPELYDPGIVDEGINKDSLPRVRLEIIKPERRDSTDQFDSDTSKHGVDVTFDYYPPDPFITKPIPFPEPVWPATEYQDVELEGSAVTQEYPEYALFPSTELTPLTPVDIDDHPGVMIDEPICPLYSPVSVTEKLPPTDASYLPPRTVRDMLCWISDLTYAPGYDALTQHIAGFFDNSQLIPSPESFLDKDVISTLLDACGHASSVLAAMEGPKPPDPLQFHYQRYDIPLMYYSDDPYRLLCQVRSYVYASYHQLSFLRTLCRRGSDQGGWRDCLFGRNIL
ncbi:Ribosome-binding protein 1, putative [Babesia ovata]|uniref:Ribosome-binding protein 1, putative n=1 Tax=Babesia ovata TaxID=189622 RepID=A0A2H6K8S0_9APIC|nr:Ribosome-binding protein 1, putative [Babesia ovata]GBE59380.1 Ribosome-binding protein 1, putative [Babesia ovata]